MATFVDAAVTPAADLQFAVNSLSIKNIADDPSKPATPLTLTGDFSAPGISQSIAVSGTSNVFAAKKTVELNVKAAGVVPMRWRLISTNLGWNQTSSRANLPAS